MSAVPICFIDTETTGLRRPWLTNPRQIWEVALIRREPFDQLGEEYEVVYHVLRDELDLTAADPFALAISGFYDRHPAFNPRARVSEQGFSWYQVDKATIQTIVVDYEQLAEDIFNRTTGAHIVGAVPSFDEESLAHLLYSEGFQPRWHYHLIDVENLAAGHLGIEPPYDSTWLFQQYGIETPEEERHTALGDARSAMRLYDAVMHRDQPLPPPIDPLMEDSP